MQRRTLWFIKDALTGLFYSGTHYRSLCNFDQAQIFRTKAAASGNRNRILKAYQRSSTKAEGGKHTQDHAKFKDYGLELVAIELTV